MLSTNGIPYATNKLDRMIRATGSHAPGNWIAVSKQLDSLLHTPGSHSPNNFDHKVLITGSPAPDTWITRSD